MKNASPLWPARFHHVVLSSDAPDALADWYRTSCEMTLERSDSLFILSAAHRKIIVTAGEPGVRQFGYALENVRQLDRLKTELQAQGLALMPTVEIPSFNDAFGVRDPGGNRIVFGVDGSAYGSHPRLPGRLQHIVFATTRIDDVVAFYTDMLGFRISDIVRDGSGEATACFMRSNDEHHSLAFFRAESDRLDHISLESTCWNDIRDWGDHFASHRIPIVWGAGRHGAGNNLFIFVRDPMGTMLEVSAEIEQVPYEAPPRTWPHEERTINLWGKGMLRS